MNPMFAVDLSATGRLVLWRVTDRGRYRYDSCGRSAIDIYRMLKRNYVVDLHIEADIEEDDKLAKRVRAAHERSRHGW